MAACRRDGTGSGSLFLMQQPHCLAVPYAKSMVSVELSTLASLHYDLLSVVQRKIACSIHWPWWWKYTIVYGEQSSSQGNGISALKESTDLPTDEDEILWEDIHKRLFLFNSDAEKFIQDSTTLYDLVFVDAYDGQNNRQ